MKKLPRRMRKNMERAGDWKEPWRVDRIITTEASDAKIRKEVRRIDGLDYHHGDCAYCFRGKSGRLFCGLSGRFIIGDADNLCGEFMLDDERLEFLREISEPERL